jgi:hypothetical protein
MGGLLPAKPGGTGSTGYYRLAHGEETPIGSAWIRRTDTSHHAQCVYYGVVSLQEALEIEPDGWFGPQTDAALRRFQTVMGLEVDGLAGPTTMKALFTPAIRAAAATHEVPIQVMGGLVMNESSMDPAAVGINGADHGLCQINLNVHDIELDQALDPAFALDWSAEDLRRVHDRWDRESSRVDPWHIAIANHNSPKMARQWAVSGTAPFEPGRLFQIEDYTLRVLTLW